MKKALKIFVITVFAVSIAACTRYALRKWFPGLYGEHKQVVASAVPSHEGNAAAITQGESRTPGSLDTEAKEEPPYPTGHLWGKGANTVVMSDGSVLSLAENTEREPRLQRIQRYYVDYRGKRMYYRPHVTERGSGAKGAPVRQDGLPPAVVPASVPVQGGPGAANPSVAASASSIQGPAASSESNSGSWRRDEYGVQHLVKGAELGH